MVRWLALAVLAACEGSPGTPDAGPPWTEAPPLPSPRYAPGVTALGQRVVVVGGADQVAPSLHVTPDVLALDLLAGVWTELPPAPVAWTHANVASSAATLYLLGGLEGDAGVARGDAYALDLTLPGAAWRPLSPMPAGAERGAAAVVVSPPHVFLLGGASSTGAVATSLAYNFSDDTWAFLPALPSPRAHAAAMRMFDGTLIVAGGLRALDGSGPLDEVWALPPRASEWQPRAAMPRARGGCAYGAVFGQLVCAGGEDGVAALAAVDSYDPVNDVWTTLPDLPAPRTDTQGAAIGSRLFVPGGSSSLVPEVTATVFVLSLFDALR